ncbi:helix-turn-helix domain-containing protein [Chitinophaga sp. OAE865]|uniref:winged helix-turn-helix transcriptional regulator n=1 Tax=Chitinophaga sp. OAE865 TaxID=2817898 RepID=UPI001E05C5A2
MALEDKNKIEKVCPFQEAMDLISGKWTMSIINTLMAGKMRFKELERSVAGINTRMLVKELKQLEARKIISRQAYATMPPTVEYSLTEKGKLLKPVLVEIQVWALGNLE